MTFRPGHDTGTLHCRDCGTALDDRLLLLGRDLCEWCQAENDRCYGPEDPEDDDFCPQCGEEFCCEDTHGP